MDKEISNWESSIPENVVNDEQRSKVLSIIHNANRIVQQASDMLDASDISDANRAQTLLELNEAKKTILHASDFLAALNELGPLNLDYASVQEQMLQATARLMQRIG